MNVRRKLKWLSAIAVSLFALYVLGMNVFLRTRVFRNLINVSKEEFLVEYDHAYSLVPGRIHVEGLTIRGRDSHVEWILALDRCDFHVSFLDLGRRRFHASHVQADGLSLRLRLRVDEGATTAEHLAALPPVPGFRDPPYKDPGPRPPPLSDAEYNLWSVQLDDVEAERVREVWTDTMRFTGNLSVNGRWFFRPARWLDVGPATVDAHALDFSYGMRPIVTNLQGTIRATVHPFDVRVPNGAEVLNFISTTIDLKGSLRTADALGTLIADGPVKFVRGEGPLDARIMVDHGVIALGTHARTEVTSSDTEVLGLSLAGPWAATLDVDNDGDRGPRGMVSVQASNTVALKANGARAQAATVTATLTSRELDLSHPVSDLAFVADVGGLETPSIQPWMPASAIDLRSGRATFHGHAEGSLVERRGRGNLALTVEALEATRASSGEELRARRLGVTADGSLSIADELLDAKGTVTGEDLTAHSTGLRFTTNLLAHLAGKYRWSNEELDLAASDLALRDVVVEDAHGGADWRVVAPSLTLETSHLAIHGATTAGKVSLDLGRAEMNNLTAIPRLLSLPSHLRVEAGRASLSLRLDAVFPARSVGGEGTLLVRELRLGAGPDSVDGNLSVKLRARDAKGLTDLSGTAIAFDYTPPLSPADPSRKQLEEWWARAELQDAHLRGAEPFRFQGRVHLTAKDASPAAAILGSTTAVPRWLINLVPLHGLTVDGQLRLSPSTFDIRSLTAKGGSDLVQLEYGREAATRDWALLVEAGTVHAGLRQGDGGSQFVLFGARPWFEKTAAEVRSRESKDW